jgi:glucose-6-phosphate 1-dehydrogenase
MIYLSVPPFAYSGIAKDVKEHCVKQGDNGPWLRMVC